jgi:hypothetical protein
MIGASRLNAGVYEQVEADRASAPSAVLIVAASSLAAAVGSGLRIGVDLTGATIAAVLTWLIWVALTYFIGTRLLPGGSTHATFGEVLRTTGFSASPGILRIFGVMPVIGIPIFIAASLWMLATFVVAIRQALDYTSSARALAVCVLGWLIHGVLFLAFAITAI